MSTDELDGVRKLYEKSLKEHGTTSKGVGWRDDESHTTRLEKLAEVLDRVEPFTVNDLGCGYGAFLGFLRERGYPMTAFRGYDISTLMLDEARKRYPEGEWVSGSVLTELADYSFACGIFNVRLSEGEAAWRALIEKTLENMHEQSRRGFAFNLLSTYVDYREPHLYYGDPAYFFDLCKRRFSRCVSLLHDYRMFEWTMVVRK